MARPSIRSVGALASAGSGNITPANPAGFVANDILFIPVSSGDNVTITASAGWTVETGTNSGTGLRQTFVWKRAAGGDAAPTITHTAGSTIIGRTFAIQNCTTTGTPFAFTQKPNVSGTTVTADTITPSASTDFVVFIGSVANADTSTPITQIGYSGTNPAFTEQTDDANGLGTREVAMAVAPGGRSTGAATGSRTSTASVAGESVGALVSFIGDATVIPVAHVSNGTIPTAATTGTSATTTLLVPYPTDLMAGDNIILGVAIKPDTATVTAPTGFTAVSNGETAGGGGVTGVDAGPTRLALFTREADGSESGSVTITLANSPSGSWGMMVNAEKASGYTWSVAGANGTDTTTGTPFTAAMGTDPGLDVDDLVYVFGSIPTDVTTPAQFSSETLTGSGFTATVTEIAEPETTQGNDLGGVVCRASVDTGPSSGVATFSATAGGTTTNVRGPIVIVRLRATATTTTYPTRAVVTPSIASIRAATR